MAYAIPFTAAAAKSSRAVGMAASVVQVFVSGSYASAVLRKVLPL
jgi:hypothetical protein